MIILDTTDSTLEVVLGSNKSLNDMSIYLSYRDVGEQIFIPNKQLSKTNGTTETTILSSPTSGKQKVVDYISIYNDDILPNVVTISYKLSGTNYNILKVTIAAGEKIEYQEGSGFRVLEVNGGVKTVQTKGVYPSPSDKVRYILGSDITNNNAIANTLEPITGLDFNVLSGESYYFKMVGWYTAAAGTTGARFAVDGPSAINITYYTQNTLAATSMTVTNNVAYNMPATSNANSLPAGNTVLVEGFVTPAINGTIQFYVASEVANSNITVKQGSFVEYLRVI